MARQKKQARTKTVSMFTIIKSVAFRTGAMDAALGQPFHEIRQTADAWNYERGRLFATALQAEGKRSLPPLPQPRDKDAKPFMEAMNAAHRLFAEGVLI